MKGKPFPSATPDLWTARPFPIQNYGVIGNNRTAVLVSPDGSIDWAPFPQFNSAPVFLALLDPRRGGFFSIRPADRDFTHQAAYKPGTNVLVHRFRTRHGGELELTDFCPEVDSDRILMSEVHRFASVKGRPVEVDVRFAPRFDYGRLVPEIHATEQGIWAGAGGQTATLSTLRPLSIDPRGPGAFGRFTLQSGDEEYFVFSAGSDVVTPLPAYRSAQRLRQTVKYWRTWTAQSNYRGRWRGAVERSALVLKLLFYRPTGAMVAAPTTSLPERLGGIRNWDYRFTWVRDTAFAIRSLFRLGYTEEASEFVYWLLSILERDTSGVRIFYSVDGGPTPPEQMIEELAGYRNSRPVRIGNAAHEQDQHDIFGNIVAVVDLLERNGGIISADLWRQVRSIVQRAANEWREPDNGIWEVRMPRQHYVYSKAMCWMALTRGADLGERLGFVGPFEEWRKQAQEIRKDVIDHGRTPDGKSLAWYYGSVGPDASLLRLAQIGFLAADDPLMIGTVHRIESELAEGPLLYRYLLNDGLPPGEGFFLACSFWRVEYHTLRGSLDLARKLLHGLLNRVGPLGLFGEEIDPSGDHLGNYPQALTHLALLSATTALDAALNSPDRRALSSRFRATQRQRPSPSDRPQRPRGKRSANPFARQRW
jgi:glucoamylase